MAYLSSNELGIVQAAIRDSIGYGSEIRRLFLSEINKQFTGMMFIVPVEYVQLGLDLDRLNNSERLTDGSIPLQSWLSQASRYVQTDVIASEVVQKALAKIESMALKTAPIVNRSAPTPAYVGKIVKEKIVHQNDMLSFAFLEAGSKAGIGVAKIIVPRFDQGIQAKQMGNPVYYSGTAWLITRELIITNHHVVNARSDSETDASIIDIDLQAKNALIEFDFNSDNIVPLRLSVKGIVATNKDLDFAIIRLANPEDRVPPARFISEIFVTDTPQVVNIIQHPFGYSKKVALRNNHIYKTDYPKVYYFTDTEKGSSGSPVFNDNWQVVALHRASELVKDVNYQGKSTGWVNEGVQMKAIFDQLQIDHKELSDEIINN
jgi:endonuclease G